MSTCQIVIVYRGHTAVLTPGLVNIVVTIGVGGADWLADQAGITIIISALCRNLHCHLHLCLSVRQTLIISSLKVFTSSKIVPNILGGNMFTLLKSIEILCNSSVYRAGLARIFSKQVVGGEKRERREIKSVRFLRVTDESGGW